MSETGRAGGTPAPVAPGVLIVEDEVLFARAVAKRLARAGFEVEHATTLAAARRAVAARLPGLILLDMRLPDGSGLDFLGELRRGPAVAVPVVVMSAWGDVEDAVQAMKLAASDYLKKPVDLEELMLNVERVLERERVSARLARAESRERAAGGGVVFIGESPVMQRVRAQLDRMAALAASPEVVPPTVLILGETGTGKDVAARYLHAASARAPRPFVHVDCASLPKDLIEAELFGHEKGAFTNATGERVGLIEAAEDGVLFLDEVGELPLELQGKLLAVLERRTLRRVGSSVERRIEAWFVAATNRDLERLSREGQFRQDLYFRLNVLSLAMPPLRERGGDVLLLAEHCARATATRYGLAVPVFAAEARRQLESYPWPGNVRELRHVVERAVLLSAGGRIDAAGLMLVQQAATAAPPGLDLDGLTLDAAERLLIERALERTGCNVSEAARQLGVTRMVMRYRMKKYGLAGG